MLERLEETIWWPIERLVWNKPQDWYREVKWAYQRVIREYDDTFVWNMNYNLAKMMSEALDKFEKRRCGYPCDLTDEEWRLILREIKAGFDAFILKDKLGFDGNMKSYNREWKKLDKIQKKGMKLFVKYYDNLWD